MNTAAQLLGGLKPALAQNMQAAFTAEFTAASRALSEIQLACQVRRGRGQLALTTLTTLTTLTAVAGTMGL